MIKERKKCLLISDFNVEPIEKYLKSNAVKPSITSVIAPMDQVRQVLMDGTSACWREKPQFAMVWTLPHKAIFSFAKMMFGNAAPSSFLQEEVSDFARHIKLAATRVTSLIVPAWTLPGHYRGKGILDMSNSKGIYNTLMRMNLQLADELAETKNVYLLNAERWMTLAGEAADDKMWYLGKIPFSTDVFSLAAYEMKAVMRAVFGQSRKVLVLDLDNTLWGGILGDEGIDGIRLGGADPIGEAFLDFQKHLLALKNRGIILAIASKNEEVLALDAINSHSEMIFKTSDFAAWRINWRDKAANIAQIAEELNLGLDSMVFIDDSPVERARVAEMLPEVFVPDWPAEPTRYARALNLLDCFDQLSYSHEDAVRTSLYQEERQRKSMIETMPSVEEWLYSLDLQLTVETVTSKNLSRVVQLLNKTNQFNLITRRMEENEFMKFVWEKGHAALAFRLWDKFGDYGLISVCSLIQQEGGILEIKDFLLSCRAMGRGVERAMLYVIAQHAKKYGKDSLTASYRPTERNKPCAHFLEENGFTCRQDYFCNDSPEEMMLPEYINIISRQHQLNVV
jgi:FkbH-like protein